MVDGDYMSLVKTRPVGQWRETLAVLATYTGERGGSMVVAHAFAYLLKHCKQLCSTLMWNVC